MARDYDVNTNLILTWRRQHACGELVPSQGTGIALLPVHLADSPAAETVPATVPMSLAPEVPTGVIEIDLPDVCIRIRGAIEREALCLVLEALRR